jgi:hypothetical protein
MTLVEMRFIPLLDMGKTTCSQTREASQHFKEHEFGNLPKTYMKVE